MKTDGFKVDFNGTDEGVELVISPATLEWTLKMFLHEDEIDEFIEKLNLNRPSVLRG